MAFQDYSDYPISRPGGLPPNRPLYYPIFSTPPGEPTILRVISPKLVIVNTHYIPGESRTVFCGGDDGRCLIDHEQQKARWAGYLLCNNATGKFPVVIWNVTEECARSCPELVTSPVSLCNALVKTWRTGKTRRSPVNATLDRANYPVKNPSKEFDLLAHLVKIFSADTKKK